MNWKTFSFNEGERLAKEKGLFKPIIQIIGEYDIHEFGGKKRNIRPFFEDNLTLNGWKKRPRFDSLDEATIYHPDYFYERTGLDLVTDHIIKIGTIFFKYELLSNRHLGHLDFGILISYTKELQNLINQKYNAKWSGSITYEKTIEYLEISSLIISVPLLIIGIDL